jgi:hypothetical protein
MPQPSLVALLSSTPQPHLGVPVGPLTQLGNAFENMFDVFGNTFGNAFGSMETDVDTARNNAAACGGARELFPETSTCAGLGEGGGGPGLGGLMRGDLSGQASIIDELGGQDMNLSLNPSFLPETAALQTIGVKRTAGAMCSDAHGAGRNKRTNSAAAGAFASGAGPSTLAPGAAAATLSPPAAGTQGVQRGEAGSAAGLDQFVSKMRYASEIEFSSYLSTLPPETLARHFAWLSRRQAQVADAFGGQQ